MSDSAEQAQTPRRRVRRDLAAALALLTIVVAGAIYVTWPPADERPATPRLLQEDFVEYWTATRLNLAGENPYSPELMLEWQQREGWPHPDPRMMWNPPQVLTLMLPVTAFPYEQALLLWRTAIVLIVLICAGLLWRLYHGPPAASCLPIFLGIAFLPAVVATVYGQIGVLILAGLTGFLILLSKGRETLAGCCLALVFVKPQLMVFFWIALLLWIAQGRKWRVALGGAGALLALTLASLIPNELVIAQYLKIVQDPPVQQWITPTLGALLRQTLGWDNFWLQFVPMVIGAVALLVYSRGRFATWNWRAELPGLIFLSLLFSPYTWIHDHVVLLIPIIAVAARQSASRDRWLLAGSTVLMFLISYPGTRFVGIAPPGLTPSLQTQALNAWMVPAWWLWYLLFQRVARRGKGPAVGFS